MGSWDERLHDFVHVVRQNHLPVSVGEALDAMQAAALVGPGDRAALHAALRATLLKDTENRRVFDELFSLFFAAPGGRSGGGEGDVGGRNADATDQHQPSRDDRADAAASALPGTAGRIAGGDRAALEIDIRRAGRAVGIEELRNFWQEGFFSYRLLEYFDDAGARDAVRNAAQAAREHGDVGAAELLEQRLHDFERQVREFVRRAVRQRDLEVRARFRQDLLMERSFYRASQDELKQIRREVRRMAERLKTRISVRRKRARHGTLHVQETLRANLSTGAVPFHLRYRRRHRQKPELVIFFDMSESVRAISEFTLMFVHSLTDLFQRVRCFAFVADTAEVTDALRRLSFDQAFQDMMSSRYLSVYRHSDYGEAIRQMVTKYGDAVTPRSTFIVLGDARSNYQPHEPQLLRQIAMRARWSLWMNPEPRGSWGLGDSVMPDYAPYFRATATVSNLKQLERVVEKLVLRD